MGQAVRRRGRPHFNPRAGKYAGDSLSLIHILNPETFCDFYESKGWKIGKDPMRDWKAAVRTWERREPQSETNAAYDLDEYESQALKELEGYK